MNKLRKQTTLLFGILLLSFLLNFLLIQKSGDGNAYYTAAIKNMLTSFKNFFYVSFDSGYVSVDKPPLGLWIQALSAAVFGLKGWAVILPQTLAAVISVLILYILVKQYFGSTAGLISALILTVTPIFVAVSRTNNFETLLLCFLLIAVYFLQKAVETSHFKWLFFSAFVIGLAFNIKMFAAFIILPAFFIFYLVGAKGKFKYFKLIAAFLILILVSFCWATIVDMTSQRNRPYVGSSKNNSVTELAFGYNGLIRLLPQSINEKFINQANIDDNSTKKTLLIIGKMEGGNPGLFRIFNKQMGGQTSWFFIMALFAFPSVILNLKKFDIKLKNPVISNLIFWGTWLITSFCYFSIAVVLHRYYMVLMAPPLAALAGIAVSKMWKLYKNRLNGKLLLPIALFLSLGLQCYILSAFPNWGKVLIPMISVIISISVVVLIAKVFLAKNSNSKTLFSMVVVGISLIGLIISPVIWSITPIIFGGNARVPCAGPELSETRDFNTMIAFNKIRDSFFDSIDWYYMINFLNSHKNKENFFISVPDSETANHIILRTDAAVMCYGGFLGTDKILTIKQLSNMAEKGKLRFILINGKQSPFSVMNSNQKNLAKWLNKNGTSVSHIKWFRWKENTSPAFKNNNDVYILYDLKLK